MPDNNAHTRNLLWVFRYKGGTGMWSWFLHRLTGVGIVLFLLAHIIDTALLGWGPDVYNKVIAIYATPLFRMGEVGLAAAVIYHAINGMRITLIDFWQPAVRLQERLFYIVIVVFVLLFLPTAYIMLAPLFGAH